MDLTSLWTSIKRDLARARAELPDEASSHDSIRLYEEFLGHNELQLACESLERYADDHVVRAEFWDALRDAAVKMGLPDASRYEIRASERHGSA